MASDAAGGVGRVEANDDPAHMTLVAAYRTFGIPVLVGDFLITANQQRVGLKKKVHLLKPNLAVGWTGTEIAAHSVFTYLRDHCPDALPTKQALERSLTSFPVADLRASSVQLVGWIYDERPYCFSWWSNWPQEVFYNDYHLAGSGAGLMERMILNSTGQSHIPGSIRHDIQGHAIKETLWDVSRLMADEVGARHNQAGGFGHAYEVLAFNGREFHYVEHVLFVFVEVGFDGQGECISSTLHPVLYRTRHVRDYAVVQLSRLEESHVKHEFHLIQPVYRVPDEEADKLLSDLMSRPDGITFDAQYCCVFASLLKNAHTPTPEAIRPVILVNSAEDQNKAVVIGWQPYKENPWVGRLTFDIAMAPIEAAYRAQMAGQI